MVRKAVGVDVGSQSRRPDGLHRAGHDDRTEHRRLFRHQQTNLQAADFRSAEDETVKAFVDGQCMAYTTRFIGALRRSARSSPTPTTTSSCPRSSRRNRWPGRGGRRSIAGSRSRAGPTMRCWTPRNSASPRRTSTRCVGSDNPEIKRLLGVGDDDFGTPSASPRIGRTASSRRRQLRRDLRSQCRTQYAARSAARTERASGKMAASSTRHRSADLPQVLRRTRLGGMPKDAATRALLPSRSADCPKRSGCAA